MGENASQKKYLKFYQKLAYGSGDLASNCSYGLVSSFLLLYLTSVMGMNSAVIGTLMLVSKCVDGVTDVFFGNIIDRTHSKMEKPDRGCYMHKLVYQVVWHCFSQFRQEWEELHSMHISSYFIPV